MTDLLTKLISPQGQKIYQLLKSTRPMTAKEIGKSLNIYPHAVYRSSRQLLDLGFMNEIGKYPVKFQAKTTDDFPITFINGRNDLLQKTNADVTKAKHEVNFIISG